MISVIIPALNEEEPIADVIRAVATAVMAARARPGFVRFRRNATSWFFSMATAAIARNS